MPSFIFQALFVSSIASVYACPGLLGRDAANAPAPIPAVREQPPVPTRRIALTNVRIFDGYKILDPSTIVIDGTIISDDLDNVDSIVDGDGGILLPGFVDSHSHPSNLTHLETLSSYGVTTVFSQNCIDASVCASLHNQIGLATYLTSSNSAKGLNSSHAIHENAPLSNLVYRPDQAAPFIERALNNGSDWIKIINEEYGPDQATQNAVVLQAHAHGKKVMTHAADLDSYIAAINSKADGPQHIPLDGVLNSTYINKMHQQGQFATPTMAIYYEVLTTPGGTAALGQPSVPFEEAWSLIKKNVLALHQGGIPILAGTDATPDYGGLVVPFGTTLHDEMYYLVQAGLAPGEALRAATLMPALAYNLNDIGRIEPGKRADLVLLQADANPFTLINDTRKIARVWNGGLEYTSLASA